MSTRSKGQHTITRRGFLAGMLAASTGAWAAGVEQAVPHSTGSAPPRLDAPAGACDCHHHIYDERFSVSPHWRQGFPPGATAADYRLLQRRLGTDRSVVVQPSTYGTDNRCLVDALGQLGSSSRGVAVVDTDVKDAELRALADAGVRAIRVNFVSPQSWGTTTPEMLTTLAKRVNPFGWHVQILMLGDQIVTHESVIRALPTKVVIDHLGRIPQPDGIKHPAFAAVRRMLDEGRTWVKVTEPYEDSKLGLPYLTPAKLRELTCRPCRNASCGARTGRIPPSAAPSRTMPCCLIYSRTGHRPKKRAVASW